LARGCQDGFHCPSQAAGGRRAAPASSTCQGPIASGGVREKSVSMSYPSRRENLLHACSCAKSLQLLRRRLADHLALRSERHGLRFIDGL
jgi:hypothetical protein